jgi:hypothetical protein
LKTVGLGSATGRQQAPLGATSQKKGGKYQPNLHTGEGKTSAGKKSCGKNSVPNFGTVFFRPF